MLQLLVGSGQVTELNHSVWTVNKIKRSMPPILMFSWSPKMFFFYPKRTSIMHIVVKQGHLWCTCRRINWWLNISTLFSISLGKSSNFVQLDCLVQGIPSSSCSLTKNKQLITNIASRNKYWWLILPSLFLNFLTIKTLKSP